MKDEKLLGVMEDMKTMVAAYTGLRQQFIDAGWHPHNAESMVIALLENGANK